jgi:hypothetical protein
MTGQGVVAGATVGAAIGSSVGDKQNDLLNKASIARGKKVMGQAYNNLQDSTGYSDEQMTDLTNNMLNDPEGLKDMQQMAGESNEDYMRRTMLKDTYGNELETEKQWNDRMMYAQSLYSLQNKYQQSGVDGDDANARIADSIRKKQNINAHMREVVGQNPQGGKITMDDIKNIRSIKDVSKNIERNREWRRYTKFENKRYEHTLRWMKEEQNRQEP